MGMGRRGPGGAAGELRAYLLASPYLPLLKAPVCLLEHFQVGSLGPWSLLPSSERASLLHLVMLPFSLQMVGGARVSWSRVVGSGTAAVYGQETE